MRYNLPKSGENNAKGVTPLQRSSAHLPVGPIRQTWLHYFNDYLRKYNVITEEEWRKMRRLIEEK